MTDHVQYFSVMSMCEVLLCQCECQTRHISTRTNRWTLVTRDTKQQDPRTTPPQGHLTDRPCVADTCTSIFLT